MKIEHTRSIVNRMTQLYGYTDNISLVLDPIVLKDLFLELKKEAKKLGLMVNEGKTEYLTVSPL